ncbi:MAG TPA: NIPSNAP family protein [Trebonia sp.]|nr:NIPSNAP family protein [Trebonia sp.]
MIYELREYVAHAETAERLHRRFADHTFGLFRRHGLTLVHFWTDLARPERIVYLLAFDSQQRRDAAWAAFQADPDWKAVKEASEAGGPLLASSSSSILSEAPYWTADRHSHQA